MTLRPYDAVAVLESEAINTIGNLSASSIQPSPGVEQTLTCLSVQI